LAASALAAFASAFFSSLARSCYLTPASISTPDASVALVDSFFDTTFFGSDSSAIYFALGPEEVTLSNLYSLSIPSIAGAAVLEVVGPLISSGI